MASRKKDGNLHLHRLLTFVTLKPVDSICSMDILYTCHGVIIIIIYCPRTDSSVLLVDVIFIYRVSFPKSHFEELNRQNHEAIASLQNINHRAGQAIQFLQLLPLVRKQNVDVNSAVCGVLIFSRGAPAGDCGRQYIDMETNVPMTRPHNALQSLGRLKSQKELTAAAAA